ncbi:MAG: hypothetical protein DHS20C20_22010 [Ardenticatenaceae bacterium]|nr:MAG: hypothetical protein DHS20C20_22010 [Ardenticatenaceae bacterium]
MNNVPESVFQNSLEFLEQGESTEQILARFPEYAAELQSFLETAAQLATLAPQPSLAAKQKSQKAFLAHAESLNSVPVRPSPWYRLRQILLPIASLAVVLILFATMAVSVSGSAIPGDALYSVKRFVENVRLNQVDGPETAVALAETYRQERIREVQALLRTGRTADVSFEGEVASIQPDAWQVDAIEISLDEATNIVGQPQVGELARVNGRTDNGMFLAKTIEMLTGSPISPLPEAEPTATPSPTGESTPTATLKPTTEPAETLTPTATSTPSPTVRITETPTSTVTATPTATPSPTQSPSDDDDDDGGNDDNNSNDDDDDDDGNGNDDDDDGNGNDDDDDGNGNDDDDDGNSNDDDDDGNDNDDDDDGNDNDDDDDNSNDDDGNDNGNDNDDDDNGNDNDGNDNDDDDD